MSRTPELKSWLPDMVAQICKVLRDPEIISNNLTYGRHISTSKTHGNTATKPKK